MFFKKNSYYLDILQLVRQLRGLVCPIFNQCDLPDLFQSLTKDQKSFIIIGAFRILIINKYKMSPLKPNIEFQIHEPDMQKNFQKVSLIGNIDRDTMEEVRTQMENVIVNLPTESLMLDMSQLDFINSEGIGYLSDIFNRLYTDNKHLLIFQASARIMDIFQLVGLNQIIPCCDNEDECLAKITQA